MVEKQTPRKAISSLCIYVRPDVDYANRKNNIAACRRRVKLARTNSTKPVSLSGPRANTSVHFTNRENNIAVCTHFLKDRIDKSNGILRPQKYQQTSTSRF
jgi:hypothetical protein